MALALCILAACKDDGDQGGGVESSSSDSDGTDSTDDDDSDASATTPTEASADEDSDDSDDVDTASDPDTSDPDTSDSDTSDPDDTGNGDTAMPGDSIYEESFDGPDGSAWPEPWRIIGTHIIDAELDGGRGRMSGDNNLTARLALDGFDVMDVDVTIHVEYEDWTHQGYGFYARQNGGALQETSPPGQGYGVYAEGGNTQSLGVWKEIGGVEMPILEVPGAVPGGVDSGVPYVIRFQCEQQGATTALRAKMWPEGETEPANWIVDTDDATPELQNLSGSFANDVYNYQGTGSVWVHQVTINAL